MSLPALVGAQSQHHPLSYRGWGLGISLDSATALTKAQMGKPLTCVGTDTKTMFCETDPAPGYASLYFSPTPRRLEEITLLIPIDRRASRDSLTKWFKTRWGPPIPREVFGKKSTSRGAGEPTTEVIGSWAREGMVFGQAAIATVDTARMLALSIFSPARQIRLMQERVDTSRKTK